jgi:hypothetical protein
METYLETYMKTHLDTYITYRKVALLSLVLMAAGPCMAQSPQAAPNAAPAPSSSAPAASPSAPAASAPAAPSGAPAAAPSSTAKASDEPSPDLIKQARREGYKPEKQKNGETRFCKTEARMNSRFEDKTCVKPDELQNVVDARQDQRNLLNQTGACVGAGCKSH